MSLQVSEVVEFIHSIPMFSKWQESESSSSSVPVRSSLQSIVTSPTDESGTRPITQMGSVTDNSAAQEVLYQRRVEEGCDLFIDPDYV